MATAKKTSKEPASLEAISNLLDTKLDLKLAALESKLTSQLSSLQEVVKSLDIKLQSQVSEVQRQGERIAVLEDLVRQKVLTIETLEKKVLSTAQTVDHYKFKVTDLENRSRRQNLRIIGLPENFESGDLIDFFSDLLWEVFGSDDLKVKPTIDRAHRVSKFSATSDKPRAVIVRLHYPREKERLIRLARQRGIISVRGVQFRIVEDYSYEVMRDRIAFKPVMAEIYRSGLKQALRYPANLRVTLKEGTQRSFKTPADAKQFLEEYRLTITS